jgi:hypothetical protein
VLQHAVLEVVDLNKRGFIEFGEFLTAVCFLCSLSRDQLMHHVFMTFGMLLISLQQNNSSKHW